MREFFRKKEMFVVGLIVLAGLPPIIWYFAVYGFVPTLLAQQALEILENPEENATLIDVQTPEV